MLNFFKKALVITLALSLCLSLVACKKNKKDDNTSIVTSMGETSSDSSSEESEAESTDESSAAESATSSKDTPSKNTPSKNNKPGNNPSNVTPDAGNNGGNGDSGNNNPPSNVKNKTFDVHAYGAKGDGKTDDGVAIATCIREACKDGAQSKTVKFRANATYRIASILNPKDPYKSLMNILRADNITIEGNNTKLLMKAPYRVARVQDSSNVVIKGFVIDYDPKPFALGTVVSKDTSSQAYPKITFKCDYDLGFSGTKDAPNRDYFAFRNRKDERLHFFIERMQRVNQNTYTFTFNSIDRVNLAQTGDEFILPVYGNAHLNGAIAEIKNNHNFTMEDFTINAMPDFGIGARRNSGNMIFRNVKFKPTEGSKIYLTSWRDGFHFKDNTAKILWDKCYIGPLGDDAFNIASVTCGITAYNPSQRIITAVPHEDGTTREGLNPGDEIIVYDNSNGTLIGYSTIQKVIQNPNGVSIQIKDSLNVKPGQILGLYRFNKNFLVKDSYIEGTVRVRSSGTFQNCKFNVFWVRVENDTGIEGPIPKDVFFRNCSFTSYYGGNPGIFHVGTNTKTGGSGGYKCKNIVLDHCTFEKGQYYAQPGNELFVR